MHKVTQVFSMVNYPLLSAIRLSFPQKRRTLSSIPGKWYGPAGKIGRTPMTEVQRRLLLKLADPLGALLDSVADVYDAVCFVFKKREEIIPT